MVRQCCVCKILDYKEEGQHLSFHVFPVDLVQRNIWLSLLAFEANHKLSKQAEACSNHFQQSDIECSSSGIRRLRKGAVPLAKHSLFSFPENVRYVCILLLFQHIAISVVLIQLVKTLTLQMLGNLHSCELFIVYL
ncbi:unnamed protein product [Acanthoscelides obtectus]|uniref:THAP-type domain-containing protein n=1 Tax=Acanthoscelides obtectus TaxID=200917 RepID=A0A9P0LHS7_ACAOB|nr:unnamed protein product [Acanthoscelides obtectus]CAK1641027.1 DNA transposase THAP9 [Acanthoscelides obtectus]